MKMQRIIFGASASLLALALASSTVAAADYPNKPIKIVLGFAAGGGTDQIARMIGQKLSEQYKQPVIVENKEGAGTNIAAEYVARSAPDGYTLFMGGISNAINASLYSNLRFDFLKDFAPVALVVTGSNVLMVNPSVPAKNLTEFIALAKAKPGEINYASSGSGSSIHLSGELFKLTAGVDMVHIPYKGSAPALTGLLGGQVQAMFDNILTALPYVKAGKLRALGVTSSKRSAAAPDIPTIAEAGLPGYVVAPWIALWAPAQTPKEIVDKLNADINKALQLPDVKERLTSLGSDPGDINADEFGALVVSETAKWAKVVKAAGARVE